MWQDHLPPWGVGKVVSTKATAPRLVLPGGSGSGNPSTRPRKVVGWAPRGIRPVSAGGSVPQTGRADEHASLQMVAAAFGRTHGGSSDRPHGRGAAPRSEHRPASRSGRRWGT